MKELMKTNVYDVGESVLIVGSCLPDMEPEGLAQLCASSGHLVRRMGKFLSCGFFIHFRSSGGTARRDIWKDR